MYSRGGSLREIKKISVKQHGRAWIQILSVSMYIGNILPGEEKYPRKRISQG
jgi:hypothetical protein